MSFSFVIVPLISAEKASVLANPAPIPVKWSRKTPGSVTLNVQGATGPRLRLYTHDGTTWHDRGSGPTWTLNELPKKIGLAATPATDKATLPNEFGLVIAGEGNPLLEPIACRIAPVLLTSSLDPVQEVFVVRNKLTARFAEALARLLPGCDGKPTLRFMDYDAHPSDIWMQDTTEIGVQSRPNGRKVEQAPVVLSGLRDKHDMGLTCGPLDTFVKNYFAGRENVVVQPGEPRAAARWIDWYGNLEVTPPVKKFPHGRVLTGEQRGLTIHPDLLAFLEAQQVQWPPLILDVGWLTIGHIDELINFVPAKDRLGFRVLLPSPTLARRLLEEMVSAGQGKTLLFPGHKESRTVEQLLEEVARSAETRKIEAALTETRARLRTEIGMEEADIVEMPVLFKDGLAVIPNGVNSLVIGRDVLIPAPLGLPEKDDRFQSAIRAPLKALGLRPHFLDVFEPYHVRSGEIHCGTNALRRLKNPVWW